MALTSKQENFCQCVADGKTQADAYRASYSSSKMTSKQIIEEASKLMSNPNISQRVAFLREELSKRALWTREESIQALKVVVDNPERNTDIVAAVKELNAMHGYNAPSKVELSGEVSIKSLDDFYGSL
jgi:phage terminase small subunit